MASSKPAIYSALIANLIIAVTKFIAAAITGSSAMVSEGIHSVVDTTNEILLLVGIRQAAKPPDVERPFGYGKELYFWSFIVSILIFSVGGGISFYEGFTHLQHPEMIKDPFWSYIVLGIAFVSDGISFIIALKNFNRHRGDKPFWSSVKKSKDPTSFVVLFEDAADVLGLLVAFIGVYLGHKLQNPYFDGFASIVIGLILTAISIVLTKESRSLLMGETASTKLIKEIVEITESHEVIASVHEHLSMVLGPSEILLILKLTVNQNIPSFKLMEVLNKIKGQVKKDHPQVKLLFIEPEIKTS
ncbi:MAG: cation diffusion facilitator family transporter [Candidatus Dadabacteria bacterium]